MWIKLLGICLVCVSCAGIGGGEALRLIDRRRFLEEVKRIAAGLRGEIGYTQAVLPLVLCRAGARGDGKAGKLFLVAGERLEANPECPFGRIWEAVLEEQGEGALKEPECTADLNITANIAKTYVTSGEQRMDLYRRMAAIRSQSDADDLLDEIVDRYGDPPKGVLNLIDVALLRARAAAAGITEISQKDTSVMIFMAVLDFAAVSACCAAPDFKGRIFFAAGKQPQLTVKLAKGEDALKIAQKLVGNYAIARSSSTESGNP